MRIIMDGRLIEFHNDTTRTVTTYDSAAAATSTRPYTADENTAADAAAQQQAQQQVQAQLATNTTADLTKLQQAITNLATLLGDNTTMGSIRSWKAPITNNDTLTGAQGKALADLLISEAQATRRIARQVLRLARSMVGDYSSSDVGSDM